MSKFIPALCLSIVFLCLPAIAQIAFVYTPIGGIGANITVSRDGRGIPYIEAKTDDDLYFAQGYITASDRLWQMDLLRRLARGETAEIFGKTVVEQDKRWRRFNFSKVADESLRMLSGDLRSALENYARGVNAYISSLDAESMPIEFRILQYEPREWTPSDTIVIGKILSDALSTTWRNDLLRASLQGLPKDKLADLNNQLTPYDVVLFTKDTKRPASVSRGVPGVEVSRETLAAADRDERLRQGSLEMAGLYAEELAASNNWVISGKRTATGKPILANDPHLAPTVPGIWYLTHLSNPSMRVSGVTLPGVPGIILGHNEHIAWGATNVGPDVQDLYVETFNEAGQYKTPTGWETPVARKEVIKVRPNLMKPDTEDVELDVVETRHGPIITEEGNKKYALRWTALDPNNSEFDVFYRWNRTKNWKEFKNALRTYGGAAQNFIYADVKGNIGWAAASRIPIRRTGDGSLPYDGSTNEGDWVGVIPFDDLPTLYNPPGGLIVTANQRIVGTSYKYSQMSRDAAAPWRARRIFDELGSKTKITMDDVNRTQNDTFNIPLANLAKEVLTRAAASGPTLAMLDSWDGHMSADSRGALLANEIRECLGNRIAAANKPVPAYLIRERILDQAIRENWARWLPPGYASYGDVMKECDGSVRNNLVTRYGADPTKWVWGKVWQSRFPHPLASAPLIGSRFAIPSVPLGGSGQSANVGSSVSMRFIVSPGDWDAASHLIPLGQSGDPSSPHFKDQFEAWSRGQSIKFPFTKAAVEKASVGVTVFTAGTAVPPRGPENR